MNAAWWWVAVASYTVLLVAGVGFLWFWAKKKFKL